MEEELLRLMGEYGLTGPAAARRRVLIQSFDPPSLQKIHAFGPSLPLVCLYKDEEDSETIREDLEEARTYVAGIGPSKDDVDRSSPKPTLATCRSIPIRLTRNKRWRV